MPRYQVPVTLYVSANDEEEASDAAFTFIELALRGEPTDGVENASVADSDSVTLSDFQD